MIFDEKCKRGADPITILYALISTNLLTIALMWLDKRAARKQGWRVPEASLYLLALLGGSLALVLMMKRLRHKTKKGSFYWRVMIILLLQLLVVGYLLVS